MIQLIACDIDGTLLQSGEKKISPRVFEQIERLHNRGVIFCPASGRQYNSLRNLFDPIANRIYYISNNGAVLFGPDTGGDLAGRVLSKTTLPRDRAIEICDYILSQASLELVIAGENTDYICPKMVDLTSHLEEMAYSAVKLGSPNDIPEDILKITAFCEADIFDHYKRLQDIWGSEYKVAISGRRWIDVTLSDKGTGLRKICEILSIPLENVMAIGDNYNDLEMLSTVGHPVVMESSVAAIREKFKTRYSKVEDALALV